MYTVTLRFQFPAHGERDGILFDVVATGKADAIRLARRMAERDGHYPGARKGRVTFRAEPRKDST
jgi:hypothetical protein